MAIAVDASTPARVNSSSAPPHTLTTASFTAPTDALLVMCLSEDGTGADGNTYTASDSGGLTWTLRVARTLGETTDGGGSGIWTARTTSSVSRTVSMARTAGTGTRRMSMKVYVLTGVDVDGTPVDSVTASNENGSNTNNLTTTSITPGGTGVLVCCDTDWNQLGVFTSSDLTLASGPDTADYAGEISVCSGLKACTSGVGVTGNLNAGGTSAAQHKWCQIVVREAAAAGFDAANFAHVSQRQMYARKSRVLAY